MLIGLFNLSVLSLFLVICNKSYEQLTIFIYLNIIEVFEQLLNVLTV